MAAKKKSAFADAQKTVMRAFHDLERAVMGMVTTTPAKKTKKRSVKKKAKKKR